MAQRWCQKASVQAAILGAVVVGVLGIVAAYVSRDHGVQKQIMANSPGGTQIGGDVEINLDRRRTLNESTAQRLIQNLRLTPPQAVIINTNSGDIEAQRLRQQLIEVFAGAGWSELSYGEASVVPGPVAGIQIRARILVPNRFVQDLYRRSVAISAAVGAGTRVNRG